MKFLAAVAASPISPIDADKQYNLHFTSQVLTGIPELNSQYAGLRITAKAVIQAFPDLSKFKTYNDVLQLSEEKDILSTEEVEVPSAIKIHLESAFKVVCKNNYQI